MNMRNEVNKTNGTVIFFNRKDENDPLHAYIVGHLGCVAIEEVYEGVGKRPAFSYTVHFEDGNKVNIANTHYVEFK